MALRLQVVDQAALPAVAWRWEPETDILAGVVRPVPTGGAAGTLELSGLDGSVAVVDLAGGIIVGLDIVVWPEVQTVPGLAAPSPTRQGAIRVGGEQGDTLDLEMALAVRVDPAEDLIHLRVGAPRPTTTVQVADRLLVEIDEAGGLAGFWLSSVPPLQIEEE